MSTDPGDLVGLTATDAERRLRDDGPNRLPTPTRAPAWRQLAAEMVHFFALLFWVAGALAFVAGMPQLGLAVFVVVLLNGTFAYAQERRAEHASERLRDLLPRQVTVVRDGVIVQVPADDLVVGDLVVLGEGDRISADLRLTRVHSLAVDTSMLTGESTPAHLSEGETVHAGSFVIEGEGRGVVIATGGHTRLADIASLASAQRPPRTPLRVELDRVSRIIAVVAITVGLGFFGVATLLGMPAADGFLFAVGVTVAVVPCGLLPTVTLSLANGAQRMAGRHALVRHLEAVETLGSTTFICTDKTGTLTRNEMAVVEVWMPAGRATLDGTGYAPTAEMRCDPPECRPELQALARAAARCSTGRAVEVDGQWVARGDPMEAALHATSLRVGVDLAEDQLTAPEHARFPFDNRRRRMSVVAGDEVLVKGAPDSVLDLCTPAPGAAAALAELAERGLRVLAIASRPLAAGPVPHSSGDAEQALTLLGLVALEDPPRHGARDAARRLPQGGDPGRDDHR